MRGLNLFFCTAIWFAIFTGFVFADELVKANGRIKYIDSSFMAISVDDHDDEPSQPKGQISFSWTSDAGNPQHNINAKSGEMHFQEPGIYNITLIVTTHDGNKSKPITTRVCIGKEVYEEHCKKKPGGGTFPEPETPTPDETTSDCYIIAYIVGEHTYGKNENLIEFSEEDNFTIQAYLNEECSEKYSVGFRNYLEPDSLVLLTNTYGFATPGLYELLIVDENLDIHFESAKKIFVIKKSDVTENTISSQPVDLDAELIVSPLVICPNSSVKLDSTASTPRNQIDSYTIRDIYYGENANGEVTSMILEEEGLHVLELTVIGKNGGQDTAHKTVTVLPKNHPSCSVTACFKATLFSPSKVIKKLEVTQEGIDFSENWGGLSLSLEGYVAEGQQFELELDASCSEGIITRHEWKFNGADKGVDQKPSTISLDASHEGENFISLTVKGDNTSNTISLPINIHVVNEIEEPGDGTSTKGTGEILSFQLPNGDEYSPGDNLRVDLNINFHNGIDCTEADLWVAIMLPEALRIGLNISNEFLPLMFFHNNENGNIVWTYYSSVEPTPPEPQRYDVISNSLQDSLTLLDMIIPMDNPETTGDERLPDGDYVFYAGLVKNEESPLPNPQLTFCFDSAGEILISEPALVRILR